MIVMVWYIFHTYPLNQDNEPAHDKTNKIKAEISIGIQTVH